MQPKRKRQTKAMNELTYELKKGRNRKKGKRIRRKERKEEETKENNIIGKELRTSLHQA